MSMTATSSSPRQRRVEYICSAFLIYFTMGGGGLYLFAEWKLGGGALVLVGMLVGGLQSQLRRASARVDELEKKLAAR